MSSKSLKSTQIQMEILTLFFLSAAFTWTVEQTLCFFFFFYRCLSKFLISAADRHRKVEVIQKSEFGTFFFKFVFCHFSFLLLFFFSFILSADTCTCFPDCIANEKIQKKTARYSSAWDWNPGKKKNTMHHKTALKGSFTVFPQEHTFKKRHFPFVNIYVFLLKGNVWHFDNQMSYSVFVLFLFLILWKPLKEWTCLKGEIQDMQIFCLCLFVCWCVYVYLTIFCEQRRKGGIFVFSLTHANTWHPAAFIFLFFFFTGTVSGTWVLLSARVEHAWGEWDVDTLRFRL